MLLLLALACTPGQNCRTPCQVQLPHPKYAEQSWATLTLDGGRLVHQQTSWQGAVAVVDPDGRKAKETADRIRRQELDPAYAEGWVLVLDEDATVREYGARPSAVLELVLTP
ncbi:MAG: hypothetical protein VX899_26425 [Myxococcota bacterium]|nr:hypothetical protein [Myxococcota bacterium]